MKIACIGHMSKDYVNLLHGSSKYSSFGGCALFSSIPAVKIGIHTHLISKTGSDIDKMEHLPIDTSPVSFDPESYKLIFPKSTEDIKIFSAHNNNLLVENRIVSKSDKSTSIYIFQEKIGGKVLSKAFVLSCCSQISNEDIFETKIFENQIDAYLMCPMIGEISYDTAKTIKENAPLAIISIDAQGNVRKIGNDNFEYYDKWDDIGNFSKHVDVIKLNEFEAQYAFGIDHVRVANKNTWREVLRRPIQKFVEISNSYNKSLIYIITMGKDGLLIGYQNELVYINAFDANEIDSFGAGDTSHVAFLKKLVEERRKKNKIGIDNIITAGIYSSAAGSLAVESLGISESLSENGIEKRMLEADIDKIFSIYNPYNI